jgi:MFS family permease
MNREKIYIYGKHALNEALSSFPHAILKVFLAEDKKEPKILEMLAKFSIPSATLKINTLPKTTEDASHQGVVATINPSAIVRDAEDFFASFSPASRSMFVLLDGVHDPHNCGAIIRSAVAFGASGVLLGGVLTGSFNWHWIFLINIPIGILVFILSILLLPKATGQGTLKHLDIAGAVTVTMSLLLAVFGIVNGNQAGWASVSTLGTLGASVATMLLFLFIEAKVPFPLIPLSLLRLRNVAIANIVGVLWSGGMFAWFFLSALYMQLVLHYTPLQVGLSFLPSNIIMAVFSLGLSAKIVLKMGIRASLTVGLFFVSMGLFLFVRAPVDGTFLRDILPNMVLLGIGAGIAFNPMLLAAMKDVREGDSGLASGLVNTSFMMGGALGLAVLASLAASRTESLLHTGLTQEASLVGGYQAAFFVGTIFALLAALAAGLYLRTAQSTQKNA